MQRKTGGMPFADVNKGIILMDLYQSHLLMEGIRTIEKNSPSNKFNADFKRLKFEDAVLKRAKLAELRYKIMPIFIHLKHLMNLFLGLMFIFFLILGASSISTLLVSQESRQINFFWALLLLIIPNTIAMFFWGIFYLKPKLAHSTWLVNLSLSLISLLDKLHHKLSLQSPHYLALFQYYFKHRFGRYMGRIQLSFISHLWWSSYLIGGLLSLLVVLATHQVDFIWQTTILNEDTFLLLTQLFTYLPESLGINVPSLNDVSSASINVVNDASIAQYNRIAWSNLLIFSLAIYALLPRLLLALTFHYVLKRKEKRFKVDFSQSYYLQLKNILQPITVSRFIKDEDNSIISKSIDENLPNLNYNQTLTLPSHAFFIAIELTQGPLKHAYLTVNDPSVKLINIIDADSEELALSELQLSQVNDLVLFVDVKRLPDRGWLTLLKKCRYKSDLKIYLVLLSDECLDKKSQLQNRLQDWIEMANQADIEAEYITYKINKIECESIHREAEDG